MSGSIRSRRMSSGWLRRTQSTAPLPSESKVGSKPHWRRWAASSSASSFSSSTIRALRLMLPILWRGELPPPTRPFFHARRGDASKIGGRPSPLEAGADDGAHLVEAGAGDLVGVPLPVLAVEELQR